MSNNKRTPQRASTSAPTHIRHAIIEQHSARLAHMAHKAMCEHGLPDDQITALCIVVDSQWRILVDALAPGYDWDQFRAAGLVPAALIITTFNFCESLCEEHPDMWDTISTPAPTGMVRALVLDDTGCSAYDLEPLPISLLS